MHMLSAFCLLLCNEPEECCQAEARFLLMQEYESFSGIDIEGATQKPVWFHTELHSVGCPHVEPHEIVCSFLYVIDHAIYVGLT